MPCHSTITRRGFASIRVELVGKSPMLMNRLWSDGSGWEPKTDQEQAESRLLTAGGSLYLPRNRPPIAIGRAAHSKGLHGPEWPMEIVHAQACGVLWVERVDFAGEWTPQVFLRRDLPLVALPRFDEWTAAFTLEYDPERHREGQLREMLDHSGRRLGLPQFAPFAGRGPWGLFEVTKWEPVAAVATVAARVETVGV